MGKKGKKGKKQREQEVVPIVPPEPVLAEPTGPCTASDIVATPAITSAPGGADRIPHAVRAMVPPAARQKLRKAMGRERPRGTA